MNAQSFAANLPARLLALGFTNTLRAEWLDSPLRADGFLRVVIEPERRLELYRLSRNEVLQWEMKLSLHLPEPIFCAALNAAFTEIGVKPKTYRAMLNGRPAMVTVPE